MRLIRPPALMRSEVPRCVPAAALPGSSPSAGVIASSMHSLRIPAQMLGQMDHRLSLVSERQERLFQGVGVGLHVCGGGAENTHGCVRLYGEGTAQGHAACAREGDRGGQTERAFECWMVVGVYNR
jgi:hypothetical protein